MRGKASRQAPPPQRSPDAPENRVHLLVCRGEGLRVTMVVRTGQFNYLHRYSSIVLNPASMVEHSIFNGQGES